MDANEIGASSGTAGPFTNAWPALVTGIVATMAALVLDQVAAGGVLIVLVGVSALAAGCAVAIQPRSSVVLALAAGIALSASFAGQQSEWDSARMVLRILAVLACLAALVLLCPPVLQRVLVSVFLLFHFAGILTAVGSASQGWVPNQLWVYVYRPYLLFMYLNNAYHFYSPEPGPSPLLWFCIEYEADADGSRNLRWVKIPSVKNGKPVTPEDEPIWPNVEYTRRLSLAENTNYPGPVPLNLFDLAKERINEGELRRIPINKDIPLEAQYREPNDIGKRWIGIYARHVANTYRHHAKPDLQVTGVKVYRVIHNIIGAAQLAEGMKPDDRTLYFPYYMGEFTRDGAMKPTGHMVQIRTMTGNVTMVDRDPFLYWLIPIMRPIEDYSQPFRILIQQKVKNYVLVHAGDVEEEELP
jgi:hypothetical protein